MRAIREMMKEGYVTKRGKTSGTRIEMSAAGKIALEQQSN